MFFCRLITKLYIRRDVTLLLRVTLELRELWSPTNNYTDIHNFNLQCEFANNLQLFIRLLDVPYKHLVRFGCMIVSDKISYNKETGLQMTKSIGGTCFSGNGSIYQVMYNVLTGILRFTLKLKNMFNQLNTWNNETPFKFRSKFTLELKLKSILEWINISYTYAYTVFFSLWYINNICWHD